MLPQALVQNKLLQPFSYTATTEPNWTKWKSGEYMLLHGHIDVLEDHINNKSNINLFYEIKYNDGTVVTGILASGASTPKEETKTREHAQLKIGNFILFSFDASSDGSYWVNNITICKQSDNNFIENIPTHDAKSQILNLNFYHQWRLLDESWYYIQSQGRYVPTDQSNYTRWKVHNYKIVDIKLTYQRKDDDYTTFTNIGNIDVYIGYKTLKPGQSEDRFGGVYKIKIGNINIKTLAMPSDANNHYFTCQAYIIKVDKNEYAAIFINHPRNIYNEQTGKFELLVNTAHDTPVALPQFGLEVSQFIPIQSFNGGNSCTINASNFFFPVKLNGIINRQLCLTTDVLLGRILNDDNQCMANVPVTIARQWTVDHWSYSITVPNISKYPSNFKLELY